MNEIKSLEHPTLKVCKNVHKLTHYKLYTLAASPYFVNLYEGTFLRRILYKKKLSLNT